MSYHIASHSRSPSSLSITASLLFYRCFVFFNQKKNIIILRNWQQKYDILSKISSCFEQQLLISILLHKQKSFTRLFFLSSLLRFSSHLSCFYFYFYFIEFYFCFYCATHSKYYASFVIIGHWSASICYLLQKKRRQRENFLE